MSLPRKWWISVFSSLRHQSSRFSPCFGTTASSSRCSRSERRTRRTSSCRDCRESRSRSTGRAAKHPNRAAARKGNGPSGSWRFRAGGVRHAATLFQEYVQLFDIDEEMIGLADFRGRARKRAHRLDQFGRAIMRAALVASVAVLAGGFALRADPFDETIGQERPGLSVIELRDLSLFHQSCLADFGPDLVAGFSRFGAIGAAVVVELDVEAGEIFQVRLVHLGNPMLLGNAFLPGADHDGGAVGVVAANVDAALPRSCWNRTQMSARMVPTRCPMWAWPFA